MATDSRSTCWCYFTAACPGKGSSLSSKATSRQPRSTAGLQFTRWKWLLADVNRIRPSFTGDVEAERCFALPHYLKMGVFSVTGSWVVWTPNWRHINRRNNRAIHHTLENQGSNFGLKTFSISQCICTGGRVRLGWSPVRCSLYTHPSSHLWTI